MSSKVLFDNDCSLRKSSTSRYQRVADVSEIGTPTEFAIVGAVPASLAAGRNAKLAILDFRKLVCLYLAQACSYFQAGRSSASPESAPATTRDSATPGCLAARASQKSPNAACQDEEYLCCCGWLFCPVLCSDKWTASLCREFGRTCSLKFGNRGDLLDQRPSTASWNRCKTHLYRCRSL